MRRIDGLTVHGDAVLAFFHEVNVGVKIVGVELVDFEMVSAEKYIRRTAVRWSLMGAGMRVIELANLEHRRNKKKLCNFDNS